MSKLRDSRPIGNYAWIKDELKRDGLPLETPSHNGEWKGSVPVRTIPYGLHGDSTGPMKPCNVCKRPTSALQPNKRYCSAQCRRIARREMESERRQTLKDALRGQNGAKLDSEVR